MKYMMSKLLHTSNMLACARPQITVFMYTTSYATVCLLMRVCQLHHFSCSSAGMLMFQPMACRSKPQVNRLHDWFSSFHAVQHTIRLCPCKHMFKKLVSIMLIDQPCTSTLCSHSYHSVAARKSGQPHSAHVKQSDLSIVVWQSDDPLVGRDAYPERSDHAHFESDMLSVFHFSLF